SVRRFAILLMRRSVAAHLRDSPRQPRTRSAHLIFSLTATIPQPVRQVRAAHYSFCFCFQRGDFMTKNMRWKWILIIAVVAVCIAGLAMRPIRLGLDLRGGSHIVLQVQLRDAFEAEADSVIERLKADLRKANVAYVSIDRSDPASAETAGSIRI